MDYLNNNNKLNTEKVISMNNRNNNSKLIKKISYKRKEQNISKHNIASNQAKSFDIKDILLIR